MRISVIGLGRMGANISRRLMAGGHEVVGFDRDPDSVSRLVADGAIGAASLEEAASHLASPRIFWVMLPAGAPTEDTIAALRSIAQLSDVVIDGGNSFFKDDSGARVNAASAASIMSTSARPGGVWGLERGYCLMIGGDDEVVRMLDPIFATLAPGLGRWSARRAATGSMTGPSAATSMPVPLGAGHFVKMVHNGIEYGLMQAYAEGFDILKGRASDKLPEDERFAINLPESPRLAPRIVISSWLLDLCALELGGRPRPRPVLGPRRRQRRRAVDRRRRDGRSGARDRPHRRAVRPLPQPHRAELRRQAPVRHAVRFRRPCRNAAMKAHRVENGHLRDTSVAHRLTT